MQSPIVIFLEFVIATVAPAALAGAFILLERRTKLGELGYWHRQVLYGVLFGLVAILGTEFGIKTLDATMNVRDAAPVTAGLFFGGPAGIIAGLIGGIERWFAALWGRGMFTRTACSIATIFSGVYAAVARKQLFEGKRPLLQQAFVVGITAEVLHLLLIFLTNTAEPVRAFRVVLACSRIMIPCSAIAVVLAGIAVILASGEKLLIRQDKPTVSWRIQNGLLIVVSICLVITVVFTAILQNAITQAEVHNTLALATGDARGDLRQASRSANNLDLQQRAALAVGSQHVGSDGFIMVYAADGTMLSTRYDAPLGDDGADRIWEAMQSMPAGKVGSIDLPREKYYYLYEKANSLRIVALMPVSEAELSSNVSVLVAAFMEELVLASLFVAIYLLVRRTVVVGVKQTNDTLTLITAGDLDERVDVRDSAEFDALSDGINATVGSLKDAIAAEAARINTDLATARAIQEGALPRTFPPFPEIPAFDVYAIMDAAREVGGDFYDIFLVGEHTVCILVADVSGKGIPASLFMMAAKAQISNNVAAGMELAEALMTANWHLCQGNEAGMFVTVWAALLDYETGELTYVNAGHNPPLLRHDGTWEWLRKKGGLFMGAFDTAKYRSATITLEAGDLLFLYTDGVNEAFSAADEQYGDDRLEAFLTTHADYHPHELTDALRADLARWATGAEQSDDITMLALEFGVPPEARGSLTVPATIDHLDDVYQLIHGELAHRWCPISVQHQIDIALEELYVNVCHYAYADAGELGDCRVEYIYNTDPSSITISLTDWGAPFDPLDHDDPAAPATIADAKIGGLGIFMVKRLTDDLSYIRDEDSNVVAFRKSW